MPPTPAAALPTDDPTLMARAIQVIGETITRVREEARRKLRPPRTLGELRPNLLSPKPSDDSDHGETHD